MNKPNFKITKTNVECYKLRTDSGHYWADITIDVGLNGESGRINIASDYGSWSYYWGACGTPFKKFLAGLDQHYVAKNFGADKFFNAESTISGFKNLAKEVYKGNKPYYQQVIGQIDSLENSTIHKEEFIHLLMGEQCNLIMKLYDGSPDLNYTLDPGFKKFWEMIWPVLLEEFKKEESKN